LFFFELYYRLRAGFGKRVMNFIIDFYLSFLDSRYKELRRARRDRDLVTGAELLNELSNDYSGNRTEARYLSIIASDLGSTEMAQTFSTDYFSSFISTDISLFLDSARHYITPILGNVDVEYFYAGGNENIGSVLCKTKEQGDLGFGKIISTEGAASREIFFYNTFLKKHPFFSRIIPEFYGVYKKKSDGVAIIFMSALRKEGLAQKRIGKSVISINSIVESISYSDAKDIFSKVPLDYSKPFGRLFHLRLGCEYAMSEVQRGFSKHPSVEIVDILSAFEMIFLHSHAYSLVDVEDHYSFCHNDFHWRNMYFENGVCRVFDWSTFSIGLRGWDMATYFSDCEFTFEEIFDLYISYRFDLSYRKDQIGSMFFCFALVLNIARRHRGGCESKVESYFKPALFFIEDMYKRINGEDVLCK